MVSPNPELEFALLDEGLKREITVKSTNESGTNNGSIERGWWK